ncbi:hypothetical protein [Dictyobacter formicarum]|uniref:Uncharacterized protein n=1 Tax=Dictyobacter formicarum TaxID=2778368 RepID=A0ABQ3VA31_9CHLR|nr:hypothetical protein [Dictyobacter formicarum]GHO83000.1 hypothetical protein KSZ_10060 [Dictyobacter formicarum]
MFRRFFGRERSPQIIGMQPGPITGDLDGWEQDPNNCPAVWPALLLQLGQLPHGWLPVYSRGLC